MLTDTHPEAEAVLISLWQKKTPAERFARLCELSAMTRENAKRAIQQANPEATESERTVRFIELHYGCELAREVREHLRGRQA